MTGGPHGAGDADARVADLARLLIGPDPDAAEVLLGAAHDKRGTIAPLCTLLLEPAARRLGDLWSADDCSEYEVTLGLCRLQTAIRRLEQEPSHNAAPAGPVVLVAPQPGETHLLGAALDAELLWRAGWDMHARFPDSDAELQALLAETWFDVLDLSLSAAFRREHWLPRLTRTIERARRASRNPALLVVVAGRLFCEEQAAAQRVGANLACTSAAQTVQRLLAALPPPARPDEGGGRQQNRPMHDADGPPPARPRAAASRDPLHGVTLEAIVTALVARYGWAGLAERLPLRCFSHEPSIASSLKMLRKTPWAREKVEGLYRYMLRETRRAAEVPGGSARRGS
jgi:hypothetical protein